LSESEGQSPSAAALAGYSGRTAWARNLAAPVRDFLQTETGGAAVMLAAVVAALLWANSPWSESYESLWGTKLSIRLGGAEISADLRRWIGEGLMTIFFLVVGLEAKRELDVGQLRERRRAAIPAVAAIGGVLTPVAIFLLFNDGGAGAHGWGVVMATDTAFALGMLALVAPGGTRLRVALLTFAVADDLIALLAIATVYTEDLKPLALAIAAALFVALLALRYAPGAWRRQAAAALGVGIWVALFDSGVDPIVAGLAVGLVTSAYPPERAQLEQVTELTRSFREQPTPELARTAQLGVASAISPNERLQHRLHPWTSYLIVPLFALANAGIQIDGTLLHDAIRSPLTIGIVCGSVLGKPLGILGASWLASRPWLGGIRPALSWPAIAGGGTVAGVGFTVALLVANRAFSGEQLNEAKLGVLVAATLASLGAWLAFRLIARLPARVRARQIGATSEAILDLSDDVDLARDHVRGAGGALVTLIEYGDYECPYCGQAEGAIRELLESFGDDLRYVWRHLPLNDVHPHAQLAAEAAEAAHAQGAFWEMHDTLLGHQDELTPADLRRDAERLGLDVERFWEELRGSAHLERVEEDVAGADASGVAGTPSFFVNGRRHRGAYDAAHLAESVRAARNRAHLRAGARAASPA
jgi:Na+/H+ antiporter NhaA